MCTSAVRAAAAGAGNRKQLRRTSAHPRFAPDVRRRCMPAAELLGPHLAVAPLLLSCSRLPRAAGSSTVQRQTVGGDSPWWLTLVSNWVGPIVQNWIS